MMSSRQEDGTRRRFSVEHEVNGSHIGASTLGGTQEEEGGEVPQFDIQELLDLANRLANNSSRLQRTTPVGTVQEAREIIHEWERVQSDVQSHSLITRRPLVLEVTGLFTIAFVVMIVYQVVNTAIVAVANTSSIWQDVRQFMDLSVDPNFIATLNECIRSKENGWNDSRLQLFLSEISMQSTLLVKFGFVLRNEFPNLPIPLWSLTTLICYAVYVSAASSGALAVSVFATLSVVVGVAVKWRMVANLIIKVIDNYVD